ncbi:MAG: DUF4097 family beta strand repeat-containing protein [Candidatus Coproplasma sp.]
MKRFKKFIALSIVMIFIVALGLLGGCGYINGELWADVSYDNESAYTVGGGEIEESVSEIEIDWKSTLVTVEYHQGSVITIQEIADKDLEEGLKLRYLVDNNKLTVQFATNGRHDINGLNKKLTVHIPEGVNLNKLTINGVGSEINSKVAVTQLYVNTVTGDVTAENVIGGASVNSVSGNIDITSSGVGFQVASVGGNIKLTLSENLTQANFSTVSGTIVLVLPETLGFKLTFSKIGGSFNSELETSQKDNTYTRLDGKADIDVNCVSGNVNIEKG